jgi:hypothetical protein
MKEEEMKIKSFKQLVAVLEVSFLLLCIAVIGISVNAQVFIGDPNDADLLKNEPRHNDRDTTYPVRDLGDIIEDGESKNLLFDNPLQYQLSQRDKGEDSAGNTNEKGDVVKDDSSDKTSGSCAVFEPIQYCQGRFKKLGGTGVEIITIRCSKVDDSCNCEADKKSPTKWIECGGARKESSIGSDLLSCESKIIGPGAPASSE